MEISESRTAAPAEGRAAVELETFALLDRLRIPYAWVAHETADTIADCDVVSEVLGISICKNLFLCNRQKTAFYLLTMPGGKPFQTKVLSAQLGTTRLSFAPPELMESMLRCTPGSASVLGLAYDTERRVRLVMDRAVHDAADGGPAACLSPPHGPRCDGGGPVTASMEKRGPDRSSFSVFPQWGEVSLMPTMPVSSNTVKNIRAAVTGSLKIRMPTATEPTAPMPVQTA